MWDEALRIANTIGNVTSALVLVAIFVRQGTTMVRQIDIHRTIRENNLMLRMNTMGSIKQQSAADARVDAQVAQLNTKYDSCM